MYLMLVPQTLETCEALAVTLVKKMKKGYLWLNKLPQEIVLDIFSRLPVESLLQCKRVLRSWNTLISDPRFINTHLLRASQQYPDILVVAISKKLFRVSHVCSGPESVKSLSLPKDFSSSFVNSCNGLLAFPKHDYKHHNLFVDIWNPYTKKRTKCPSVGDIPLHPSSQAWNFTACGFGYDPILNEYKVVALFEKPLAEFEAVPEFEFEAVPEFEAVVCTIGSTSWRHIKGVPFIPSGHSKFSVHLNGTVYWFASVESIKGIGSFGIRDEKFGFVACPPQVVSYASWEKIDMSVLGSSLCLVDYQHYKNVEVWALKKHSEGDEVWTKEFVLIMPERIQSMQLLYVFNNGEILLRMVRRDQNKCVYYDPKENRYRDNEILTALLSSENFRSTIVHVGSLVSPPLLE